MSDSIPLSADKLFTIGPFSLTNTMLYGIIVATFIVLVFGLAAKRSQLWPKSKLAFYCELLVEMFMGLIVESLGSKQKAQKHFPLLFSLFVFILACNLSGLLPGVGSITLNNSGNKVPLLRAFTTDINSTLGLAILSLTTVQVYAIKELGLLGHILHYFHNKPFNPLNFFTGINELFGELMRLVTLSLRLFGVMYGGEALIHALSILAGNFAWAATLPIMFLEIFFSIVQAYLFMMLTSTYLSMATVPIENHDSNGKH